MLNDCGGVPLNAKVERVASGRGYYKYIARCGDPRTTIEREKVPDAYEAVHVLRQHTLNVIKQVSNIPK